MNPLVVYSAAVLLDGGESSTSFIPIWVAIFLCIILPMITHRNETVMAKVLKRKKDQEEKTKMTEFAKNLIGMDCIIYLTAVNTRVLLKRYRKARC